MEPGSNFCDMCGASASAGAAPPQQPPPPTPPPTPHTPGTYPGYSYPSGGTVQGRFVVEATNAALPFPQGKAEIVIGREDPISNVFPDIDLTNYGGDEGGVSRRHARVLAQGGQAFVEDLNSTNHTLVNQQRLTPGVPHPLQNGDEVQFGRVKLRFYM